MKKTLLFAAAASVALAGCVKNDPANGGAVASDAKISFDAPAVGAVTRAELGEIVGIYPTEESFKVWGWYHEGNYTTFNDASNDWKNYMTDASGNPIAVSHNGETPGSWVSATDYYWPKNGGKLTFAAYSPADAVGTYTHVAEGLQIAGFTVAAAGAQYDLMYSDRSYNRTASDNLYAGTASNTYTTGVDIVFHHALSSIVFKVGTTENYSTADLDFKIKKIEIKGANNTGSFTQGIVEGTSLTVSNPAWSGQTGTADYVAFAGSFNVPEDGTTRTEPTDAEDLILLPQTFSDSHDVVVEITYTMETTASGEIEHVKQFNLKDATNAATWEPNKRYTYQILFGVEKILFAPVVEDWTDVTVTDDIKF